MQVSPDQSYAASACAKIILLGEHAVVYGQPALAVPVSDVRARASARPGTPGSGITLIAPDLGGQPLNEQSDDERAQALLLAAHNAAQLAEPGTARPDIALTLASEIPMARGMGSSAAVSAAISRAVCRLYGLEIDAATLSGLVYRTEALLHGRPSGVDNTVVAYERAVWFTRGHEPLFVTIGAPLHLLIVDTGAASRTKDTVAAVRRQREQAPTRVDAACAQIGALVTQARQAAEHGDLPGLGRAMRANHGLLQSPGSIHAAPGCRRPSGVECGRVGRQADRRRRRGLRGRPGDRQQRRGRTAGLPAGRRHAPLRDHSASRGAEVRA